MTYEYDCHNCGRIEVIHKMNESINECPHCKNKDIKRIVTGGQGFKLVGRGWAKDGYSKD
jgi:putative FmdB family regulatory protein